MWVSEYKLNKFKFKDIYTFWNIDLWKIFSSASHLEELWFSNWQFNIEEEFIVSKQEYNIKRISMLFWGDNKHSGWVDQVDKLEWLAKAVSNSSLCYSLKQIHIHDYDLDEKKVKLIFERHGLQRIIDAWSM